MLPRTTYLVGCVPIVVLELCFKTLYVWKREIESGNRKQNQCYLTRHTKDYTTLLERFSHRCTRWTRASQSAPSTKSKPTDLHHSASPKASTHKQTRRHPHSGTYAKTWRDPSPDRNAVTPRQTKANTYKATSTQWDICQDMERHLSR